MKTRSKLRSLTAEGVAATAAAATAVAAGEVPVTVTTTGAGQADVSAGVAATDAATAAAAAVVAAVIPDTAASISSAYHIVSDQELRNSWKDPYCSIINKEILGEDTSWLVILNVTGIPCASSVTDLISLVKK